MNPPSNTPGGIPQSLFDHLTTDDQIIGVVGWLGTITGVVSLLVTLGGFWLALEQLKRVKRSSEAARDAVVEVTRVVREREQNAKLTHVLAQLRSAITFLARANPEAAGAYLGASFTSLVEARHLSSDELDREKMGEHVIQLRRILEDLQPRGANAIPAQRLKLYNSEIHKVLGEVEEITAKLRYNFADTGVA